MKITGMVLVGSHEPYIEYCIKSIENICDEVICVCDPAGYMNKILRCNDKFKFYLEEGEGVDFAKWRNKILDEATGDWILWLDADEVFAWNNGKEVTRSQVEALLNKLPSNIDAINFLTNHFMYNYFTLDGRNNGEHYSMRLFKNDGRRFKKKVHEFIDLKRENTATIWEMMIWHFGHCKGVEELTGKYRERRIKDNPYTGKMSKAELEQYLKSHNILRGRISTIRYDGVLPKVMNLW